MLQSSSLQPSTPQRASEDELRNLIDAQNEGALSSHKQSVKARRSDRVLQNEIKSIFDAASSTPMVKRTPSNADARETYTPVGRKYPGKNKQATEASSDRLLKSQQVSKMTKPTDSPTIPFDGIVHSQSTLTRHRKPRHVDRRDRQKVGGPVSWQSHCPFSS